MVYDASHASQEERVELEEFRDERRGWSDFVVATLCVADRKDDARRGKLRPRGN